VQQPRASAKRLITRPLRRARRTRRERGASVIVFWSWHEFTTKLTSQKQQAQVMGGDI
jgi:hypothetical protein